METLKQILIRYLSTILLVLTIVGLGYFAFTLWKDKKDLEVRFADLIGTQDKYQQLTKYTAQLQTDYDSQKTLAKQAEEKWKEVSRSKDEQIKMLSDATYLIGKNVDTAKGPDYYFKTPKGTRNLIVDEVRLNGPDSPPVGFVVIKNDGTTYKGNYKFEVKVENLETVDQETGKVKVYSKAFYVALENGLAEKQKPDFKKWKNVEYPLPVVGGEATVDPVQVLQEHHFYYWAPRFVGGFNVGANPNGFFMKPMLGTSFMGYGASRRDLDWRFLQFGVDSNSSLKNVGLDFVPLAWRPFKDVLSNTYIGPGVGWDQQGTSYLINVSLGF